LAFFASSVDEGWFNPTASRAERAEKVGGAMAPPKYWNITYKSANSRAGV
jgi:hypothetical protein